MGGMAMLELQQIVILSFSCILLCIFMVHAFRGGKRNIHVDYEEVEPRKKSFWDF